MAISLAAEEAEYWADRGSTYLWMERYQEALADFDRAIELKPDLAWAIAHRGETYRRMERYQEALADFDRAIELKPDDAWAILRRGEVRIQLACYDEALTDLNLAIALEPTAWRYYSRALVSLALTQSNKAHLDLKEAIRRAEDVYEEDPGDWRNTLNLALYYLASGETEASENLYQEALGGASLYQIRAAIRDLEEFLHILPNHSQAQTVRNLLQKHLQEAEA